MAHVDATIDVEHCVLRSKLLDIGTGDKVTLQGKGLASLLHCCTERGHKQLQQYLESGPDTVNVHDRCRNDYVRNRESSHCLTTLANLQAVQCLLKNCAHICPVFRAGPPRLAIIEKGVRAPLLVVKGD